jgi:hypothetical protein
MHRHRVGLMKKVTVMVSPRTLQLVWTIVLAAVPMVSAVAQDTGIVRISDRGGKAVQAAAFKAKGEFHTPPGAAYGYGHDGHCQCPECMGGRKAWKLGKNCDHYCSHSPDHGYSIPGKWPIHRRGMQYNSYYPAQWLGVNGVTLGGDVVYPMVYQPTDTTQLGFYYQHVPFWTPQPNPLPPRPIPAQWHMYAPTAFASTFENGFSDAWGAVVVGGPVNGQVVTPTPVQQPVEKPAADPAVPPAPLQESAVPQPIERIGY